LYSSQNKGLTMIFKIEAMQRIMSAESPEQSDVDGMIKEVTKIMGAPKGSDHNLKWSKPLGNTRLTVTLEKSNSSRYGLSMILRIPEIGYSKDMSLVPTRGRDAKWAIDNYFGFTPQIQKLPKYKELDEQSKKALFEFSKQYG